MQQDKRSLNEIMSGFIQLMDDTLNKSIETKDMKRRLKSLNQELKEYKKKKASPAK